jgi:hypothetical protein
LIKQSTQQRGKRRNKERGFKSEPEKQNPKWISKGQRNKPCSKDPTHHKKHIREKERDEKLEKAISLEEP